MLINLSSALWHLAVTAAPSRRYGVASIHQLFVLHASYWLPVSSAVNCVTLLTVSCCLRCSGGCHRFLEPMCALQSASYNISSLCAWGCHRIKPVLPKEHTEPRCPRFHSPRNASEEWNLETPTACQNFILVSLPISRLERRLYLGRVSCTRCSSKPDCACVVQLLLRWQTVLRVTYKCGYIHDLSWSTLGFFRPSTGINTYLLLSFRFALPLFLWVLHIMVFTISSSPPLFVRARVYKIIRTSSACTCSET